MTEEMPALLKARLALAEADLAEAERAAATLRERGFQITHIGQRGVGFSGAQELFQQVFHSQPQQTTSGFAFAAEPDLPEPLAQLAASVYFPTKPEFFGSKEAERRRGKGSML